MKVATAEIISWQGWWVTSSDDEHRVTDPQIVAEARAMCR